MQIAIVEDDTEVRNAVSQLIKDTPGFSLTGAFDSAEQLIANFNGLQTDIILMDIHLPGNSGISAVKELKSIRPGIQYMMFTVFEDSENIFESLCAGATGYLLKNTPPSGIIEAIRDLHAGGSPMSSQIARKVVAMVNRKQTPSPLLDLLGKREKEILDYLSKGYRYKEIAGFLFISTETVRTHIRNIYEKLEVQSRTDALNKLYPKQ